MRLKQLLVVLLSLLAFGALAAAAAGMPQLTNVSVVGQGSTSTVTLHASGAFTHNEYRPADNLLLIDLTGVSAGKLQDRQRALQAPGIKAYHVVGYTGAGGTQIARVELNLVGKPAVRVNETMDGLVVEVTPTVEPAAEPTAAAAPVPAPAPTPELKPASAPVAEAAAAPAATVKPTVMREPVRNPEAGAMKVRGVSAVRGADGVSIEVVASGPVKATSMKLDNPSRIVLDIPNAVPASHPRPIAVNAGDVRSVRMGQFQNDPPITRVVIDMLADREFDVTQDGGKISLKFRPANRPVGKPAKKAEETILAAAPAKPVEAPVAPVVAAAPAKPVETPAAPVIAAAPAKPVEAPVVAEAPVKPVVTPVAAVAPQPAPSVAPAPSPVPVTEVKLAKASAEPEYKGGASAAKDFVIAEPRLQERRGDSPDPSAEPAKLMAANHGPATTPAMSAPLMQSPATATPQATTPAAPAVTTPSGVNKSVNFAAEQRQQAGQQGASTKRYTGEPININVKDLDLKDFFRVIHEISGLNVVLDPSVNGSLTLVLDDVPWDQALDIVLKNNGLDRQLEGNVLRIATVDNLRREAEARRRQIEAQSLAVEKVTVTRFLSYAHAKDVLPTLRRMLSSRGEIVADERTNGLIIDDIPNVIPAIDNLLAQLDRKTQEVEIEARVVAATRTFVRDIGTQLGFGFGNGPTAVGGGSGTNSPLTQGYLQPPPYFVNPSVPFSDPTAKIPVATGASVPLFSNLAAINPTSGLSFLTHGSNYRLDSILTMAEARGLLKILSRPRVITQNNIQAIVKQGQRVPIVTLGQLGGPPSVAYIEAVLRLTVTPQITVENTIFLNVDIENTSPDYSQKILGNPVFLTQQATTQVLVTNGGTVVIGGVLQSQNSVNTNQVPLLGDIPLLGNLFKRRGVNTATQELIFFITPRIVET